MSNNWKLATATGVLLGFVLTIRFLGTGMFGLLSGVNVAVIIGVLGFAIKRFLDSMEDKRRGIPTGDERIDRVNGRAGYLTMHLSNYLLLGVMWYSFMGNSFDLWEVIQLDYAIIGVLVVNSITFLALRWYFDKPEVTK